MRPFSLSVFILLFCSSFIGCRSTKILHADGLKFAKLGNEMFPVGIGKLKGHAVRDTLCSENEYQWRASILKYKEGKVWIEEDFFGGNMINRIRIETPEIILRNGMRVGMPISALLESNSEWFVSPMPIYQKFDFYSRLLPGYHFVVDEPGHAMDSENYEDYPPSSFNPNSKVVAIVVY